MPKYVCDFETVNKVGESLCEIATEMRSSVSSFSTKIASDLSSWTGQAKDTFNNTISSEVTASNANADEVEKVGTHIKDAVAKIQEKETELASLTI